MSGISEGAQAQPSLAPYWFTAPGEGLRLRQYAGLSVLVVLLAWKLLRGLSPGPVIWYVHVAALLGLAVGSFFLLLQNRFRLRTFDMSLAVFVFCFFVVFRIVAFGNYRDAFTTASLAFFGHLYLTNIFTRVSDRGFFNGITFVLGALAAIEIAGIIEYVSGWGLIDYAAMEAMEGVAPIEGTYAGRSFILFFLDLEILQGFVGRLSGISGTPYATGGLMSAIAAFGLASKRWLVAGLGITALLLSSTGSAALALFLTAAVMYRRNPKMYLPLLLLVPFLIYVFAFKGFAESGTITEVYLPVNVTSSLFDTIVMAVIGEGRHVSSVQTELRILGLLLSLGMVGLAALVLMIEPVRRGIRLPIDPAVRRDYRAAGYFVLALFLSTLHYPTLFIYPNIMIVVVFLALVSSRLRLAHAAAAVPPGARLAV